MATRIVAGQERPASYTDQKRRATDRPVYRAAQRSERVIIVAIGALAARSAGEDITRAILVLVILMAIAEFSDWFFFQQGYRLFLRDLADDPPARSRVRVLTLREVISDAEKDLGLNSEALIRLIVKHTSPEAEFCSDGQFLTLR